jgi:dGTPase
MPATAPLAPRSLETMTTDTLSIRERLQQREDAWLDPRATRATQTRGRAQPEDEDKLRTAFQRDRDRILHCKAFRRMKHKTQVFVSPQLDHYRTRLTHVLEVTQISRTVARALRLNEDLTEAIGLGHDMGHAPFGHDGEYALDEAYRRYDSGAQFRHYEQSLRIVDALERRGQGLNLTWEVRDGILYHSKGKKNLNVGGTSHWHTDQTLVPKDGQTPLDLKMARPSGDLPATLEGQVVRMCDRVAYVNHDIDDAIRAGLIRNEDLPRDCLDVLGRTQSERITTMVNAIVEQSLDGGEVKEHIEMRDEVREATDNLKNWMFANVYLPKTATETPKVRIVITALFDRFMKEPELMRHSDSNLSSDGNWEKLCAEDRARCVCDYIAGMTDRFASETYTNLFLPSSWRGV